MGLLPPCILFTSHCLACFPSPLCFLPLLPAGRSASQLLCSYQGSSSSPARSPLHLGGSVNVAPLQGRVCHFYEIMEALQGPLPCKALLTAPASSLTHLLQGHTPLAFITDFPSSPPSAPPLKLMPLRA